MSTTTDIFGSAVQRIHEDAQAIFSGENLPEGLTAPRVTLDLPSTDPEPFHVFTWGQVREITNVTFLTHNVYLLTFKIRMTLVASGSTAEDAARVANLYLANALQITLCDNQLGGAADEVGVPQVVSSDAWADQSGRRHAGYLIEFEVSKSVKALSRIKRLLASIKRKVLGGSE